MKQIFKQTAFLIILMCIFTSSQEKSCFSTVKAAKSPVVVEKTSTQEQLQNEDSEMPIMPISRFILLQ